MPTFIIACCSLILMAAVKPTPHPTFSARPRLDDLLSARALRRERFLLELRLLDMRRRRLGCAEAVVRHHLEDGKQADVIRACDETKG